MNLDDFKSAWREQQREINTSAVDRIAKKVQRKVVSFERRLLIRDIIELLAVVFVVPAFVSIFLQFDSWVVKAGAAIVIVAAIQIAVVLLLTRFYRRTRSDQDLVNYTTTELRRVETQIWLLQHVASWYVAPIMLGCFLISWGRDPFLIAIFNSIFFLMLSGFLVLLNRWSARRKLIPLRDDLQKTIETLNTEHELPKPQFSGFEKMRRINIILVAMIVFLSLLWSSFRLLPAADITPKETIRFAQPLIDAEIADGLSIGIIDRQNQFTVHLGKANQQGVANDQTLYEIGSITKVFTALLLANASANNEKMLSEPADKPNALPDWQGQSITWLDLATHRSGLPRLPSNMTNTSGSDPYANYSSDKAIAFLRNHKLRRRPGTKYEYSNFAYSWLGQLLAKRANATYPELLHDQIAKPLGMSDTVISMTPTQTARFATPHSSFGVKTSSWEFADLPGAGGIRSSTADMMKFMKAQLQRPTSKLGDAIDLAWKQHRDSDDGNFAMGLGWQIARDGETRFHNGQTGGFHSSMFVNRKRGIGVIVLANTAVSGEVDVLAERLVQRVVGLNVQPQKLSKVVKVDTRDMKRLEGRYQLAPTFIFDVKEADGHLMVGITNQPTHEVYAKTKTRWFYKVVDAELIFDVPRTGPAKSLVLYQNGIRQTARRVTSAN